jgi:hypothetical protein
MAEGGDNTGVEQKGRVDCKKRKEEVRARDGGGLYERWCE